jgi:hypothetical protein
VRDEETVSSVLAAYEIACECSRAVVAEASSLEQFTVYESPHYGLVTLRWLMVHMIAETARHAGHPGVRDQAAVS